MQGPFGGGLSSVELTAAVSNLGGVGGYGVYTLEADEIVRINKDIREATDKPFNINIWVSDTDIVPEKIIDERFEEAKALFRPYFDELGIGLPEKPIIQKSRCENQVQAILDIRPPVFSFSRLDARAPNWRGQVHNPRPGTRDQLSCLTRAAARVRRSAGSER